MNKEVRKRAVIVLIISIIIELAVFNRDTIFSAKGAKNIPMEYQASKEFSEQEQGLLVLSSGQKGYLSLSGMSGEPGYLFFDIDCKNANGKTVPYRLQLAISDEGNAEMYYLPAVTVYSDVQETKYVNAHSYGDVKAMRIYLWANDNATFSVEGILYNAKVPMNFSLIRLLAVFAGLSLLWCIRPGSDLHEKKWFMKERVLVVCVVVVANLILWYRLINLNPQFMDPPWTHHHQYHKLAVAISQGEVSIPIGIEKDLALIENPYDYTVRQNSVPNVNRGWDTAFYNGKFYVYFGVVPVLLFYLPYYVFTGSAFPTWLGIFLAGAAVLLGMFYLVKQIVKRYFPNTPFLLQVILSVIAGNCMSTFMFMMRPDFYSLPIMCAMAFSIWGLGLWISAAEAWEREQKEQSVFCGAQMIKLTLGSLCMALVAGCRPQFLVGSFLVFFIFGDIFRKEWKCSRKKLCSRAIWAAVPFIIVATGLMSYNYVRFGSPVDFGANYNLTTNDMTHRGVNLGRVADGVFMYLFQPPNIGARYPYVFSTSFQSPYIGKTIREAMYGGAFFINTIFLSLLALRKVKADLKEKKLFGMVIACTLFAVIIVFADTQLAGILSRYYADFLWLLFLAVIPVLLQLWESLKGSSLQKTLILFVLVSGIWGLFMQFSMGLQAGEIESKNAAEYYAIKEFWFD